MRKRTVYTLFAVALFVCALAGAVYLREQAAPEAARLLPECDAIVYANLKPVRAATHFERNPISPNSFRPFLDATGIVPERDIDAVAFALHKMSDAGGPNGEVGYSEVFAGHFDRQRLEKYLAAQAIAQESYAGRTIYAIPSEGRTVRVALIGWEMVAASNMPTPEQIHSMLDRHRAAASPFAGSSVLNAHYGEVPAFSEAWAVGKIGLPFATHGRISAMGLELPVSADSTFVASLRLTTALHLKIEQIAESDVEAEHSALMLNNVLALVRTIALAQETSTLDSQTLRQVGDSIAIVQKKDRVELSATLPIGALQAIAAK